MKKSISVLVGGMLLASAFCALGGVAEWNASAETQKIIDVYVIAGQSNAAGCATISSVDSTRKKQVYTDGFENIYFYGKVDANDSLNANGPFNTFDKVVKFGQGFDDDRFGAEIGLADVIAQSGTENESLIVKYASGSLNITSHWCPPSKRGDNTGIGAWYDGCMDTVTTAVAHYADLGYTVNLKGTFWMQGEAESENGNGGIYDQYLTALINDMREDYQPLFDNEAEKSPFVIGKIAPTYNYGVATQVETVRAKQEAVAAMENVYCVETETYTIVDPETGNREPGCVDNWHFNGNDMLSLGLQVGNKILYPDQKKTIAMYLIAGQSNASGYSLVSQVDAGYRADHADGFDNVYYYGRADHIYYKDFNTTVNFGQGRSSSQFGSEIGIADMHTRAFPDQEAIIVKYAMGATYLVDTVNGITNQHGNWCSPSMPRTQANLSGKLYDAFIDTVATAVDYYYGLGYDIDLKGTFWMQGEAEADGSYAESKGNYKAHLKALISDLRADYVEILGDSIAEQSPFVIGKICPTFAGGNSGVNAVRAIQDQVAEEMDRVYLAQTDNYLMVDPETGAHRGPDYYHFEGNDMLALGQDVGDIIVKAGKAHVRIKTSGYGTVGAEYVFLEGEPVMVTFTATRERWLLNKVTYDGEDVTAKVVNNTYTITDTTGIHEMTVEFIKEPKYSIETSFNADMVSVSRDPLSGGHYVGEKVTLEIKVKTGYEIVSILYNGQALTLDKDGKVEVTIVAGDNKVQVNAKSDGTVITPPTSEKNSLDDTSSSNSQNSMNCTSMVSGAPIGVLTLGFCFVCLLKKRKED